MKLALPPLLVGPIRTALEGLIASISEGWAVEHTDDGHHKSITGTGNLLMSGWGGFDGQLRCRVTKPLTNQSLANNTETDLTFALPVIPTGFLEYDTDSMFSRDGTLVNFLPSLKGLYLVQIGVKWAASAVGVRIARVYWGTQVMLLLQQDGSANNNWMNGSCLIPFDPADLTAPGKAIKVTGLQTSGGALNVLADVTGTWVQITKVG